MASQIKLDSFVVTFLCAIFAVLTSQACSAHDEPRQKLQKNVASHCKRAAVLGPSLTEIIEALGAHKRVVGVSRYSSMHQTQSTIRNVGGLLDPNIELILAMKCDCVLHVKANGAIEKVLWPLRRFAVRQEALPLENVKDLQRAIIRLGELFEQSKSALALREQFKQDLKQLQVKTHKNMTLQDKTALFAVGANPLVLASSGSFANELMQLSGLKNALPSKTAYPVVGAEYVFRAQPDYIFSIANAEMLTHSLKDKLLTASGIRLVMLERQALTHPSIYSVWAWCMALEKEFMLKPALQCNSLLIQPKLKMRDKLKF